MERILNYRCYVARGAVEKVNPLLIRPKKRSINVPDSDEFKCSLI